MTVLLVVVETHTGQHLRHGCVSFDIVIAFSPVRAPWDRGRVSGLLTLRHQKAPVQEEEGHMEGNALQGPVGSAGDSSSGKTPSSCQSVFLPLFC